MSNNQNERQETDNSTDDVVTIEQPEKSIRGEDPNETLNIGAKEDPKSSIEKLYQAINEEVQDNSGDSENEGQHEKEDSRVATSDICRICHMGGFPSTPESRGTREPNQVRRTDSQTSSLSFYAYLGPLISACRCRGTVALVHAECLERWLTESGHTRCELCGHKYATKRVPRYGIFRSVIIWLGTIVATRQMLLDVLYLVVTTPLALFSCYICAVAMKMLVKSGFYEVPWMIIAMLPTCSLTLVAYWGWIVTLGRLHGRRWRRYWRSNFVIRLLPDNVNDIGLANHRLSPRSDENEDPEDQAYDDVDEIMQIF